MDPTIRYTMLVRFINIGMGINRTISMSNTIKMIAKRKNRRENGIRALWLGSNPHSKGDVFSRVVWVGRVDKIHAAEYTRIGSNTATEDAINMLFIN